MKTNYKPFTNLFKSQLLQSYRNKITNPYLKQISVRPSSLHINPNLSLHSSSKLNCPMTATQSVQNVQDLIERNKIWAENFKKNHADRLQSNATGQSPKVLWIGCSDSRVPETEILQCIPGDIFVHRNIANVIVPSDVSYLSVLQYAVEHLKVEDIVVCGHTKCGGVHASLSPNKHGFVDNWLHNIKMVAESHREELETIKDPEQKANRLIELNVQHSVNNLTNSLPVKEAWERGQKLTIHGWVYDVATGLVRDLKINKRTNGH